MTDPFDKLRPGDLLIMHRRDYADFIGLRQSPRGLWTWKGRRWRTLAQALRRCPKRVFVHVGYGNGIEVELDEHRIARVGQAVALKLSVPALMAPMTPWLNLSAEVWA